MSEWGHVGMAACRTGSTSEWQYVGMAACRNGSMSEWQHATLVCAGGGQIALKGITVDETKFDFVVSAFGS